MNNSYELFVGIDVSKGKADAAIISVSRDRNIKPKLLRKKIQFKFLKSELDAFLTTVRKHADSDCTHVTYAMEVTGVYSDNIFEFIHSSVNDNENVYFLNTQYVNKWRESRDIAKSDPLDAQTIASIIAYEYDVKYVHKNNINNEKGYADLKAVVHRYGQVKKTYSQEINRLIAQCERYFPELQYVFEPKSATFLAILSSYPTTHDIIKASKIEVQDIAKKASKNRTKSDKMDELFDLCNDSLAPTEVSDSIRSIIRAQVAIITEIKSQIKTLEKMIKELGATHTMFEKLKTLTGCGDVTAATVIAETYDIKLFKSADKYVSYMGLAPRNKRSGSSVEIMGKISKKGSRFLRHAIYMIAEFARRHNPVLKEYFHKIKNGNKKRHKLAVVAVANKVARYVYSMMKKQSQFVIDHDHLMRLPEETRNTFFQNITTQIPLKTRRQIYRYSDENGEVHKFIYTSK